MKSIPSNKLFCSTRSSQRDLPLSQAPTPPSEQSDVEIRTRTRGLLRTCSIKPFRLTVSCRFVRISTRCLHMTSGVQRVQVLCFYVVGLASLSEAHARVAARHTGGGAMIQAMGRKIRQAMHVRASCDYLTVIPMPIELQGVLHEHCAEIYHLFARHWVQQYNRNNREASALVRTCAAHTSLTVQQAQYSLHRRMLQNLTVRATMRFPISSLRQPISPMRVWWL